MAATEIDQEEAPLDPAVERVHRKLRRLMLIGGLTLAVGLFSVLGAIVYRIMRTEARVVPTLPSFAETSLPAGARLVSTSLAGDRLVLGFAVGEDTLVMVLDQPTMRVISSVRLKAQ
jgi:hypothetical protein